MELPDLIHLEQSLSTERLAPYRAACRDDLQFAIRLYQWNAKVSAALGETLGHVEVLLRNAMDRRLSEWSTRALSEPLWYLNPSTSVAPSGFLFSEAVQDIVKARARATRTGRPETRGRVVAELNLGFWRFLLTRRYDRRLWHPCLNRAFPRQRREVVLDAVTVLHEARNRIAHHEPMFNRPIAGIHATALEVTSWICPCQEWVADQSRVADVLAERPDH